MSRSRYLPGWQARVSVRERAWRRCGIKGMKRRNREREKQVCREYESWKANQGWLFHPAMEQVFESKVMMRGYW